jgi:hypothetical protein
MMILTQTVLFVTAVAIQPHVMHNLVSVLHVEAILLVITVNCVLKDFMKVCLVTVFHVHALLHQDQGSLLSHVNYSMDMLSVWIVHLAIMVMTVASAFQDTLATLCLAQLAQTVHVVET